MRAAYPFLLAAVSLSAGCAGLIATKYGEDLSVLKSKEEVRAHLGEPETSGVADGHPFEEYRTRRLIANPWDLDFISPGYAMGLIATLGTIDLILVPQQVFLVTKRTILGQTIRVTYDPAGSVTGLSRDGEPIGSLALRGFPPDPHAP